MMLRLYSWLMFVLQPLLRLKLWQRAKREPGYALAVPERFAYYDARVHALCQPDHAGVKPGFVWLHVVSLGETRASAVLIESLRQQWPAMRLLLTHGTATGRAQGATLLRVGDVQVWLPWDGVAPVQRFLQQFHPRIGLLFETEVWPNLVDQCAKAAVPLCLVNARFSEKSMRKALRWQALAKPAYSQLAAVWAQSQADAQRLGSLGAPVRGIFGNIKFDNAPDANQLVQARQWRQTCPKPVLMFASSREGEEQMWLDIYMKKRALALAKPAQIAIKNEAEAVQWLIVPRHPQRFDAVAQMLQAQGLVVSRRSSWREQPEPADVWLGDTLGDMALYFGLADAALLGGSFAPLGGQNLIEAAACGCPVLMGPHTFNFSEAAQLAQHAGAAFALDDMAQAWDRALTLVQNPQDLALARQAASKLSETHRGAAQRTVQALACLPAMAGA
jgi:3-deoxy-D-manno-octulosonic-acid transferase